MLCSSILYPTYSLQEDLCTHRKWIENALASSHSWSKTWQNEFFLKSLSDLIYLFRKWLFFLSNELVFLGLLWYLQIFHSGDKEHKFRQHDLRGFFPDMECAKVLADVGCSYNACKGTEYSARVPPPSWIPRTI